MIKHLKHHEIDKAAWDALLLRCPDRVWYVQGWVLDLCCPTWEALVGDDGSIMRKVNDMDLVLNRRAPRHRPE